MPKKKEKTWTHNQAKIVVIHLHFYKHQEGYDLRYGLCVATSFYKHDLLQLSLNFVHDLSTP
jgi:hypothetical protein